MAISKQYLRRGLIAVGTAGTIFVAGCTSNGHADHRPGSTHGSSPSATSVYKVMRRPDVSSAMLSAAQQAVRGALSGSSGKGCAEETAKGDTVFACAVTPPAIQHTARSYSIPVALRLKGFRNAIRGILISKGNSIGLEALDQSKHFITLGSSTLAMTGGRELNQCWTVGNIKASSAKVECREVKIAGGSIKVVNPDLPSFEKGSGVGWSWTGLLVSNEGYNIDYSSAWFLIGGRLVRCSVADVSAFNNHNGCPAYAPGSYFYMASNLPNPAPAFNFTKAAFIMIGAIGGYKVMGYLWDRAATYLVERFGWAALLGGE